MAVASPSTDAGIHIVIAAFGNGDTEMRLEAQQYITLVIMKLGKIAIRHVENFAE